MKKFTVQNILIPVDFSETANLALDHAVHLAKIFKASITLLHVQEPPAYTTAIDFSLLPMNVELQEAIEKSTQQELQKLADKIAKEASVKISTKTSVGRIYSGICETAEEVKADIIVMGTHGVSGFKEFFLGSNAYRTASAAPCPVLSIQTHTKKLGFERILLPIDNSVASRQKVVPAMEMAKHYGATIYIAEIATDNDYSYVHKLNVKTHQVQEFMTSHGVKHVTKFMQGDNIAKMAMDYGTEIDADLMIIMTEQEPTISGILLGQYAQQVVNHSKIPVLSIRPDEISGDFVDTGFPLYPG